MGVQMRVVQQRQRVEVALCDAVDDDRDGGKHDAEEHLGVQIVHRLHGPRAHDVEPKLRAGVAHALVEEVPARSSKVKGQESGGASWAAAYRMVFDWRR